MARRHWAIHRHPRANSVGGPAAICWPSLSYPLRGAAGGAGHSSDWLAALPTWPEWEQEQLQQLQQASNRSGNTQCRLTPRWSWAFPESGYDTIKL